MLVRNLFDLCLEYVAENIHLVESLVGFPDTVGQQIFHAVETAGWFDIRNGALSYQTLSVFTSAYTEIMSAVNMEGKHVLLADCLEHLMLFSHLTALNISSCYLGDQHEILYHISTLQSLEVLLLRDNDLTDEGIRKLTAPLRINKIGSLNIKTLDLSENAELSVKSLKFIQVFKTLQLLNLSSTAVQTVYQNQQVKELQQFARSASLVIETAPEGRLSHDVLEMMEVKTQGWAASTLNRWAKHCHQKCRQGQQSVSSNSKAKRFYGRKVQKLQESVSRGTSAPVKRAKERNDLSLVLLSKQLVTRQTSLRAPGPHLHDTSVCRISPSDSEKIINTCHMNPGLNKEKQSGVEHHQHGDYVSVSVAVSQSAVAAGSYRHFSSIDHPSDASFRINLPGCLSQISKQTVHASDSLLTERSINGNRIGAHVDPTNFDSKLSRFKAKVVKTSHELTGVESSSCVKLVSDQFTHRMKMLTSPISTSVNSNKRSEHLTENMDHECDDGNPLCDDDLLMMRQYGYTGS